MPEHQRPDPDSLLRRMQRDESSRRRGKLKIFFGASAGVGKTYTMLEEARRKAEDGISVLVGYAEPHIRPETETLLLGLDILPYKLVDHRGTTLKEFDLDAALAANPELILVDELAHTNAPAMRHAKRWQDVVELLSAGIDVYTTLNVQHLESVNDIVERATGVKVRETLPDSVFETAAEVQLVDLPPEKLIERLRDGKIYARQRADAALRHFFTMGNLLALRELALRQTADRINRDIDTFHQQFAQRDLSAVSQRVLVCVGPSPSSANLVRTAARMAAAWKAQWIALYVEPLAHGRLSDADRNRVAQTLELARQLGAQSVSLSGIRPELEIIAYAKKRGVDRILIGKPAMGGWRRWFRKSFMDSLIQQSGDIQLVLIREDANTAAALPSVFKKKLDQRELAMALAVVAVNTALGIGLYHGLGLSDINVIMLYLLGVLWVSARYSRTTGIVTTVLSVLAFDYTVVRPYYSFAVSDTQYLITFGVMLLTGLVISTLTTQLRDQERLSRSREQRTNALLQLSLELILFADQTAVMRTAVRHVAEFFNSDVGILRPVESGLPVQACASNGLTLDDKELGVAEWVIRHGQPAGTTTDTLPSAKGLYLPLKGVRNTIGALFLLPGDSAMLAYPDQMRTLESFTAQIAVAMERMILSEESQRVRERTDLELLHNTLLSAVSHDLRTPLAAITGSATSILAAGEAMAAPVRNELITTIAAESQRMERLIEKLLEMTRLESGMEITHGEMVDMEELIVAVASRWRKVISDREIKIDVADGLPLVNGDPILLEQILSNLLENAVEHAQVQTPVEIQARSTADSVEIRVMDRGIGLTPEETHRIFEKFYRGRRSDGNSDSGRRPIRGLGLGLAICRAIVQLHKGQIIARPRSGGGAEFIFQLPIAPNQSIPTMPAALDPQAPGGSDAL